MSLSRHASAVLALALGMPAIAQSPSPQPDPHQATPTAPNAAALEYFKPVSPADMRAVKIADAVGKLPYTILVTLKAPPPGPARDDFITIHAFAGTDIKKTSALIDRAQDLLTRVTEAFGKGTANISDSDADLLVKDLAKAGDGEEIFKTFKTSDLKFTQATLAQSLLATFMRDSLGGVAQLNSDLAKASDSEASGQVFSQARDAIRTAIINHTDIRIDATSEKVKPLNTAIDLRLRAELLDRALAIKLAIAGTNVPDAAQVTRFQTTNALIGKMKFFEQLVLRKLWQEQHPPITRPAGPPVQGALQSTSPGLWVSLPRPGREAAGLGIKG